MGRTALGRLLGYRSESLGREERQDVSRDLVGNSVVQLASGRRSGWGALVEHGVRASGRQSGFVWQ